MKRQIYEVYAKVVDANGNYSTLSTQEFDSKNYDNDIDKTLKRATGAFSETFGAMCKRDDRQLQMVLLMTADGFVVKREFLGQIEDLPDPEPPEPDPPEPEPDELPALTGEE